MEKSIKKAVKNTNLTFNEDEILGIITGMSEEDINDTGKYGIKHWKVLRDLVIKRMDEELKLKEEDIVSKYLIWGLSAAISVITYANSGGVFYNRIILTKNKLYVNGYDQLFRCIERHSINIADIDGISQGKAGKYGMLPVDGAFINTVDGKKITLVGKDNYARKDIGLLINDLISLNNELPKYNIFE